MTLPLAFAVICAALVLIATAWSLYDYRRKAALWDRFTACCHGNELELLAAAEAMHYVERQNHPLTIEETARLAATVH